MITKDALIAKQKELIIHIQGYFAYYASHDDKHRKLLSEIASFEQELADQKPKTDQLVKNIYDTMDNYRLFDGLKNKDLLVFAEHLAYQIQQQKPENLRDELIKFYKWNYDELSFAGNMSIGDIVDEYLSQK